MNHYFSKSPDSRHEIRDIRFDFAGQRYVFATDRQVFSRQHVDDGSRYLLDTMAAAERNLPEHEHMRGLDLGTGYGPVGIVLAKHLNIRMVLSDINERALALAAQNAERNGVADRTDTVLSDGLSAIDGDFDIIATNPPIRIGKKAIYRMWQDAVGRLKPAGRLYMVIRKQQGAESAVKYLKTLADDVAVLDKRKGYWMLCLTKGGGS